MVSGSRGHVLKVDMVLKIIWASQKSLGTGICLLLPRHSLSGSEEAMRLWRSKQVYLCNDGLL